MALVITADMPRVERISRNLGIYTGSIAFDSSYPTGGEDADDISKYFKTILQLMLESPGYVFQYDKTNDLILVHAIVVDDQDGAAGAGVAVYFDDDGTLGERLTAVNANNADSYEHLGQVPNTSDLSALTAVKFIAIGLI